METEEVGSTRTAGVPVRPSGADPVRSGGGPAEPSTAPVHQMAPGGAHRFALLLCLVKISLCGADLPTEAVVHEQIRKAFHDALDGRALRVGALEKAPFVKINRALQGNSRFSGISVGQIRHISVEYNFDIEFVEIPSDEYTFDDVVDGVGSGSNGLGDIDVAVQLITALGKRSIGAHLTASPVDSGLVYLMQKDRRRQHKPFDLFKFFSPGLWGTVFGILLFMVLLLVLFRWRAKQGLGCPPLKWVGEAARDSLYDLVCLLFGHLVREELPTDWASRVVFAVFKMFAYSVPLFIGALLAADFVVDNSLLIPDTESLCKSVNSPVQLGDLAVAMNTSMKTHIDTYAGDCLEEPAQYKVCKDSAECLRMVMDGSARATLFDDKYAQYALNDDGKCGALEIVGDTGSPQASTWVLKRESWALAGALSNAILVGRDDGSFARIQSEFLHDGVCKKDQLSQLDVDDLYGLWIVLGALLLLAVCLDVRRKFKGRSGAGTPGAPAHGTPVAGGAGRGGDSAVYKQYGSRYGRDGPYYDGAAWGQAGTSAGHT